MRSLELKIPPVSLVFLVAALMWFVSWATPTFSFEFPSRPVFALIVAILGSIISALGVLSFRQARTTVNPMKPDTTSSLVTSGIYRRTRHPMYLGFLLILLGWAIFLSNALASIFLPAFILYMDRFQIEPEERSLHSLFGQQFVIYRSRVRRWL